MAGGFTFDPAGVQQAINQLQQVLNDAEENQRNYGFLPLNLKAPGNAPEMASFNTAAQTSANELMQMHQNFITQLKAQIATLQTTLKNYQAGDTSAASGLKS